MEIHISDFCTMREYVHPYCDQCTRKLDSKVIHQSAQVFRDTVSRGGQYSDVAKGKKGAEVVILCDDPNAYGIHLN